MKENIIEEKKIEGESMDNEKDDNKEEIIDKQEDEEMLLKKNKKIKIIILLIILLSLLVVSTIFALININNNNIVSGVKIQGIEVSGLTKEEAENKLKLIYNEKSQKEITLKYKEYDTTITPELIEANYKIEEAVNEAINIGKDKNIILNNYNILLALFGKKDIKINVDYNDEIAKQTVEKIQSEIPDAVIQPSYYIENDKLIITKGKAGKEIDYEKLINKIKEILIDTSTNIEYIEIYMIDKIPEEINIEKIYEEVHKEVQDAYYTKEPFAIHPEVEGVDFNIDEAKEMLKEDKDQYEITLTITEPKITTKQIGSEAFPDLLATYSTKYDASNVDRSTNLRLATQKINDKVLLPGETFSYNQTLGERTVSAGYKNAKIYEAGQVVDGIGGGICQISTTLYNAVLMSNLEIVERKNHQFITSYVPAGRDATVAYGLIDFKFKNTRDYAIKIKAGISNGIATVSIYGIKENNEYIVSFSTKTISSIPYTVKYIDDNTLDIGKEKIQQKGANGVVTETYIIKSLNGKVVSSKLLSRDTYSAMQKIILKGTKGAKNTTTNASNTNTTNEKTEEKNKNETTDNKATENKTTESNKITENQTVENKNKITE